MNDDFDARISEELGAAPPPDSIANEVTPWGEAVFRIAAGLVLTTFTLSFLWLQYILPAVGTVMLYLGFRTLRRNNRAFLACFWLSLLNLPAFLLSLLITASALNQNALLVDIVTYTRLGLEMLLLFFYRLAVRRAYMEVGEKQDGDPLLWAMVWYAALIVLASTQYRASWIIFIPMALFYIIIIAGLVVINDTLQEWGYGAEAAPVRVGDDALRQCYLLLALVLVIGGCLVSNHSFVRGEVFTAETQLSSVREGLLELGFPEDVLADMADEDLRDMERAAYCESSSEICDVGERKIEFVITRVLLDDGELRNIVWFKWQDGQYEADAPKMYWQDALLNSTSEKATEVYGRLLYTKNGVDCAADWPELYIRGRWSNMSHFEYSDIIGKPSFPVNAENARGYVVYAAVTEGRDRDESFQDSYRYYRQNNPIRLPYADSADRLRSYSMLFSSSLVSDDLGGGYDFSDGLWQRIYRPNEG